MFVPSSKLSAMTAILIALTLGLAQAPQSYSAEMVSPGNRNVRQPEIPGASKRRTEATKSTFDAKYERIRDLIAEDAALGRAPFAAKHDAPALGDACRGAARTVDDFLDVDIGDRTKRNADSVFRERRVDGGERVNPPSQDRGHRQVGPRRGRERDLEVD